MHQCINKNVFSANILFCQMSKWLTKNMSLWPQYQLLVNNFHMIKILCKIFRGNNKYKRKKFAKMEIVPVI